MKALFDGHSYVIRLNRGERLMAALEQFVASSNTEIVGAAVSGVGAAEKIELGFYDLESKTYSWRTFDAMHEITGLLGTVARDEQDTLVFHLHGTFADQQYAVIGGHVKDFVVGGTCELVVHPMSRPLKRRLDPETGLKILNL